jgi:hypothetical protein
MSGIVKKSGWNDFRTRSVTGTVSWKGGQKMQEVATSLTSRNKKKIKNNNNKMIHKIENHCVSSSFEKL